MNKRGFLRTAGLAALGASLAPEGLAGRLGRIGSGALP